jgi:hypothetical protein
MHVGPAEPSGPSSFSFGRRTDTESLNNCIYGSVPGLYGKQLARPLQIVNNALFEINQRTTSTLTDLELEHVSENARISMGNLLIAQKMFGSHSFQTTAVQDHF